MSLKIAVIGCGWVSSACHGPAYQEYANSHPDIILGACCDIDPQRVEHFRSRFGFQNAYTDYQEMLDREQPQAVALNVPPQHISALGCEILRRGIPLLCEKPPGLNLDDLDQLIVAARSSGVIHQIAFNRRFMPLMLELKRQLGGQTIFHVEVQLTRVQRLDANFATTAIHAIDTARFLMGCDYTRAAIAYQDLPDLGQGVSNFLLDCRFSNAATARMSIFPVTGVNIERYLVYALDHTFLLQANNGPDAPGRLWHYWKGQLVSELDAFQFTGRHEDYFLNGFFSEDAAFFDAVRTGRRPVHDFQSSRQSIQLMQCLSERKASFP